MLKHTTVQICQDRRFLFSYILNKDLGWFFFVFFFLSFWRTHVLFWGHWYPCFGFLVTSPLGFKARVGSALFAIFAEANVMYIPQDSPLVLHLLTSWQPACNRSLPHMHVQRWDLAQIRTCNRTNRRRTRYYCASDPALRFGIYLNMECI